MLLALALFLVIPGLRGKSIQSVAFSPSGEQVAFTYVYNHEDSEMLSLHLLNLQTQEDREIFYSTFPSWDMTSDIQWLGERYLFFLRHCGSSCQGLSLLDTQTREVKNATLTYQSYPTLPASTFFKDWSGREFQMEGFPKKIQSRSNGDINSIIFSLEDKAGREVGKRKIEFLSSFP